MNLSKKLEDKISYHLVDFDHAEKDFYLYEIFKCAAAYWIGLDENDFCLQHAGGETLVFGSTNRLIWSPGRGFQPDRAYCTEKFLTNWERIGPLPDVR